MPEAPKAVRDDLKRAAAIEDLIIHPGWKVYIDLLQLKIEEQTSKALKPVDANLPDGLGQVMSGEAAKGAILGLRLALLLPSMIVEGAKTARQTYGITSSMEDEK